MEPRISFVTLGVSDVARSRAFYEKLGFRVSSASNPAVTFLDGGGIVLSLWGRTALAADAMVPDDGPAGFSGIALAHNVRSEVEVARVIAEAEAAGGTVVRPSEPAFWGGTAGYFADPDGHLWEVAHNPDFPLDREGRVTLPFDSP